VAWETLHGRPDLPQLPRARGRGLAHDTGDPLREGGGEARDGPGSSGREAVREQRFRANEDVEAFDEVGLDLLERRIRDLQAGKIGSGLAEAVHDVERDRVTARRLELVEIERRRSARCGGESEMLQQRVAVEPEIRRADDRDGVGPGSGGVLGEGDRVGGRLRTAVHGHLEPSASRREAELGHPSALVDGEEEALAGRAHGEHPVQAALGEKREVRLERLLVEGRTAVAKGRERGCERTVDHGGNLKLRGMDALRVEREGPVLRVTLARPERRNAFDAALIAELTQAFSDVGNARAVILAGEGPSFCAGADVEWQRSSIDLSYEENVEDAMRLYRMCEVIDACPAPVVARVQGYALGGGSGLVACVDVAVAAEDAVFGFSEVRLGIIPAVISPFVLARIGPGAARRWFLTGERFGADVALRIGLVHEVAAAPDEAVGGIVDAILAGGPEAVRAAKSLARDRPFGSETAEIAAARRTSEEGQAGLRAFLEKQAPPWGSESSS
jgi:methylglutaconyl-CoA hydratase